MKKRPVVIMAAVEVEADFLICKLENMRIKTEGKYKFYEGTIKEYPVVVCYCLIGTINATIATYITIQTYHPVAIISQGSAGAHSKGIHKGDIVVGEKCFNINSLKSSNKKEGEGSHPFEWELLTFFEGKKDRFQYELADRDLLEVAKKVEYTDGKVHFGTIGSGDCWNCESDRILWLHEKYGSLCEEMEGISIYTLANSFNIPVINIRVISNNEILGEPYDRNIGLKSQEFTYNLLLKMIDGSK